MSPGAYEHVLETLEDLDARLAGLEVGYSEENAAAAAEHVEQLDEYFAEDPEAFVALREAVTEIVEREDSAAVSDAKTHADELKRQIEAQIDEESDSEDESESDDGS